MATPCENTATCSASGFRCHEGRMTDPTGRSFLSYKRSRRDEAALLIQAQHDHGIPTWQDVRDLVSVPTEDELRRVLADPNYGERRPVHHAGGREFHRHPRGRGAEDRPARRAA